MVNKIISEILEWYRAILFSIPGKVGQLLRLCWCRQMMALWGKGSRTGASTIFIAPENMTVGNNSSIGTNCFFSADGGKIAIGDNVKFNNNVHINASVSGKIKVADNCLIGPNVMIRSAGHIYEDPDRLILEQGHLAEDIEIEEDVWIAGNVSILKGVKIARGCVIGAGSVVTNSTEEKGIYAGVPAKLIKFRGV